MRQNPDTPQYKINYYKINYNIYYNYYNIFYKHVKQTVLQTVAVCAVRIICDLCAASYTSPRNRRFFRTIARA